MNPIHDASLTLLGLYKYHSLLKRSERYAQNDIDRLRNKWLSELMVHAYQTIPWYSKAFQKYNVRYDSPDPLTELSKLPILTRNQIRNNYKDFHAFEVNKTGLQFSTSGTSGEPLSIFTSTNQWIIEQGIIWRHWKSAGYKFKDRIAIFRSYAPRPGQPLIRVDKLKSWAYFSVFTMDDGSIDRYAKFLIDWKPKFLRGYPSSLMLIASHAMKYGWRLPTLKAAFTASESIPVNLRPILSEVFGIQLFDHYGQAEITCMFHDCEKHEGMHLDWEYGIVELIPSFDPNLYKIIATNLHNKAMPLLRYDTGDLAEGTWRNCSCGRSSPIIRSIRGRQDDFIIKKDGSCLSTVNLYTYFSKLSSVRRFQITQTEVGAIRISISLYQTADKYTISIDDYIQRIYSELSSLTGLSINLILTETFEQSAAGKFPTFLQRLGK